MALGLKMKGSVAIILIVILLHLFLSVNIKCFFKSIAAIVVSFAVIFFSFNIFVQDKVVSPELREAHSRPFTHYVMMGLKGVGGYNDEDSEFTGQFYSQAEKKKANIEEIKKRLSDFGFKGLMRHLSNKAVHNTWGDGTYFLYGDGFISEKSNSRLWYFIIPPSKEDHNAAYYNIFYYYSQGFHLAILTLLMISLGMGIKNGKIDGALLFKIALFGLFLFLLIWETRARYVYSFTPLLLLIASDTCNRLSTLNLQKIKKFFTRRKNQLPKPTTE